MIAASRSTKTEEKSLACPSMSDFFVRFIVLCRTLQEWHTGRWAIKEDEKCWYHREHTFFCTPTSVEVVATPTARLSCTRHVDSPVRPNFLSFVWGRETSCDDKTRRARKVNKKKKNETWREWRGVRSNLRTYVSYAPGILPVPTFGRPVALRIVTVNQAISGRSFFVHFPRFLKFLATRLKKIQILQRGWAVRRMIAKSEVAILRRTSHCGETARFLTPFLAVHNTPLFTSNVTM